MLNQAPPPPPADVPPLSEKPQDEVKGSLRQRLEKHRDDPSCAVCHVEMDAMGFAMENFDAVGRWRDRDGTFPVDAAGKLPDGTELNGPDSLQRVLLARKGEFLECFAEKVMTYGLGRGMEYFDQCTIKDVARAAEKDGYRFSSLVVAIAQSDAFQKRRVPTEDELKAPAGALGGEAKPAGAK
jgi:hypothetical protein